MARINLSHKSQPEQILLVQEYIIRRSMHVNQGPVTLEQIMDRFKHKDLRSDKAKAVHFLKILKAIKIELQTTRPEIKIEI